MRRFVVLLFVAVLSTNCGILDGITRQLKDSTTQTVNAIDDGLNTLSASSSDWLATLQHVEATLPQDAQQFVRTEISDTISRGIAAAGTEFRCNVDFLRTRAREVLLRLRAQVLGGTFPESEPALCTVVPLGIDLALDPGRRNLLEYFGYDFDVFSLQALLVNSNGITDVSAKLDRPTPYHMTLNLGANGVQLGATSQHLVLKWKDRELSSIAVIQPATAVCTSRIFTVDHLDNVTFMPPWTQVGDRDFYGHGPIVYASVDLRKTDTQVIARVFMNATEDGGDHTSAVGFQDFVLYRADPGEAVDHIVSGTHDDMNYHDSNETIDSFGRGSGSPVSLYEFTGDTDGDDAGVRTQVVVHFNPLRMVLRQNAHCVPPVSAVTLSDQHLLAPSTVLRLQPAITQLHPEIIRLAHP